MSPQTAGEDASMTSTVAAVAQYVFARLTPDQVYSAWIDPILVERWMTRNLASRPGEGRVTKIEIDPVVGGRYRFSGMHDGQRSDSWGYYRAVDPGRRLVFTWFVDEDEEKEDNSTVTLELKAHGRGTQATMSHEMDARWAEYVNQTADAWQSMLKAIDETLGKTDSR
jgi:uncharacterized protein YndB with AHSA1/START domain